MDQVRAISQPIRILIVEQQVFIADALTALLNVPPQMLVVGTIGSVAESAPLAAELDAGIVMLSFRENDGVAVAATRAILNRLPQSKIIFLTRDEGDDVLLAAIDAGVSGVLSMSTAAAQVIEAVQTVADGQSLIAPSKIAILLENRRKTDGIRDSLTNREKDLLRWMAEGLSNRETATKMGISYLTVRTHMRNLASKLSAHSKLEVLATAQRLELVEKAPTRRMSFG